MVAETVPWTTAFTVTTIFAAMSFGCCVWLVYRIVSLPKKARQRLFPRQMLLLAVSDILLAFSAIPYGWYRFGADGIPPWLIPGLFWTWNATLLSELHIVVGFAFQLCSGSAAYRCFQSSLWLPWTLAALVAALQMLLIHGEAEQLISSEVFAAGVCFPSAVVVFVIVLCQTRRANNAMVFRSLRRAAVYVLNFLITCGPLALFSFLQGYCQGMTLLRLIGEVCLVSNGMVNAVTYFGQSRYVRRDLNTMRSEPGASSFVVRFAGVSAADLHDELELEDGDPPKEFSLPPV